MIIIFRSDVTSIKQPYSMSVKIIMETIDINNTKINTHDVGIYLKNKFVFMHKVTENVNFVP